MCPKAVGIESRKREGTPKTLSSVESQLEKFGEKQG